MPNFEDYSAPPVTSADVKGWGRLVPWWVPSIVLPVAGLGASLMAFILTVDEPCSATDPSYCGPSLGNTLALAIFLLAPVLLWFAPRLGCATAGAFGALSTLASGGPERLPFAVFTLACVLVLLLLRADDTRSGRALWKASESQTAQLPEGVAAPGRSFLPVVAAVLVLVGVGCLIWQQRLQAVEDRHLRDAQEVSARVVGFGVDDDDFSIKVRLPSGEERRTGDVLDDYEEGQRVPVLVDPGDRSWIRLQAEPYDSTGWQSGALVAFALAGLLAWRHASLRHWRAWARGRDLPAVGVSVRLDSDLTLAEIFAVDAADDARHFATLDSIPKPWPGRDAPQVDKKPGDRQLGLLLGDLRPGGLAAVLVRDGVLWPAGGLRVTRATPWCWRALSVDPGGLRRELTLIVRNWLPIDFGRTHTGPAVTSYGTPYPIGDLPEPWTDPVPDLPFVRRPVPRSLHVGWLRTLCWSAVGIGAVVARYLVELDLYATLGILFAACSLVWSESLGISGRIVCTADGVTVVDHSWIHRVPWALLEAPRTLRQGAVRLAWRPEESLVLHPYDDPARLASLLDAVRLQRTGPGRHLAATHHFRRAPLLIPLLGLIAAGVALLA